MSSRSRAMLMVGSLSVASAVIVLAVVSLWVGIVLVRDSHRWAVNSAAATQELHSTSLSLDIHGGRLNATQTRTLSQIGPIGSAPTSRPASDWNFFLFTAGQRHERSWDRRWFAVRWDQWRFGDLGWYESAGGGSISRILSVPLWIPIVVLAFPGALAARRSIRAARRRARGQCVWCGYRVGNAHQCCPECGRGPAAALPVGLPPRP